MPIPSIAEAFKPKPLAFVGLGIFAVSTILRAYGVEEAGWGMVGGGTLAGLAGFLALSGRLGNDIFRINHD